MIIIILFILPLITNAKITINVKVNSSKSDTDIKYTGNDNKIVTFQELHIFNVTTEKLNKGMRIEMGKAPHDIFLKDPTKYGNLFETYKWEPVKRSLKVNRVKIINLVNEDIVLKTHEHINNSTVILKTKRNMYAIVDNTAQSSWFLDGIPDDDFYYNLEFDYGYGKFKYENKWRDERQHSSKMPIGVTKEELILINPFQTVVTTLTATKTILVIELEYKAKLIGAAVANYAALYGKYHFWAPSMESIMMAAKMKNELLTRERIEIRCFLNPRLDVRDKITGEIVEPPKIKKPRIRILRNKNMTKIFYTRIKKKPKQQKKKE